MTRTENDHRDDRYGGAQAVRRILAGLEPEASRPQPGVDCGERRHAGRDDLDAGRIGRAESLDGVVHLTLDRVKVERHELPGAHAHLAGVAVDRNQVASIQTGEGGVERQRFAAGEMSHLERIEVAGPASDDGGPARCAASPSTKPTTARTPKTSRNCGPGRSSGLRPSISQDSGPDGPKGQRRTCDVGWRRGAGGQGQGAGVRS